MANLEYKLEYFKGAGGSATDEGVFIHLRTDPPGYQTVITKESYSSAENSSNQTDFIDSLFDVAGIVRLASQGWRLYIEKSPVFTWEEIIPNILDVLVDVTGSDGVTELPGSGLTLITDDDRRGF